MKVWRKEMRERKEEKEEKEKVKEMEEKSSGGFVFPAHKYTYFSVCVYVCVCTHAHIY